MLNNLNSVLLEGRLVADPMVCANLTNFVISSIRFWKDSDGNTHRDESPFSIHTTGHLAEVCGEYLKAGRVVRVVGRLARDNEGVFVVGEHVEFKPLSTQGVKP